MRFYKILMFFLVFVMFKQANAQFVTSSNNSNWKTFAKAQVNYSLGLNEVFLQEKLNSFQVKFTYGKQTENFGLGIGLATSNYKNNSSFGKGNINTMAFSANAHATLADFSSEKGKVFVRGGIGYAPKIFKDYAKGLAYDASLGYVLRNKKGNPYFFELQYQAQKIENFLYQSSSLTAQSLGLGIGIWF